MMKQNISDFFNYDYHKYGKYVIQERAIPSVIDGFKPTQRKIIYVSNKIWNNKSVRPLKVFQLGGRVAYDSGYSHGDSSLNGAIITMTQKFKNSLPLFDGIGQFGSLRSPDASAPRYISIKLNNNFKNIYQDFDLLEPQFEEGIEIEPKYFLPIIPTVILNGSKGIAVGYASNVLNRHPLDIIDNCVRVLENKKQIHILPYWSEFNGYIERDDNNKSRYIIKGKYNIKNTTTVEITELPYNITYIEYETYLEKLLNEDIITDYEDNSQNNVNYIIKFKRGVLSNLIDTNKLEQTLKLISYETENLTVLDENNNLKIFNSIESLTEYFVKFRLKYYKKRKDYIIKKLKDDNIILKNKLKFIEYIIQDKLILQNRPILKITKDLETLKFHKENNSFNYLLSIKIDTITKEKYKELKNKLEDNIKKIKEISSKTEKDLYLEDLMNLKKLIK